MSGDAQPRKRKDKRRKKGNLEALRSEEYAEESSVFTKIGRQQSKDDPTEELLTPTQEPSDEVIHKHKTAELGGNIVTKLVFFALLGGLVFMVGLILIEYRGSTDEDTMPAADSQWSLILDDWIEKGADLDHHDEHALHEEDHEHGDEGDHDHGGGEEEHEEHEEEHDDHEEHAEEEGPSWFTSLYEAYSEQKEEGGGGGGWLSFGQSEEPEQKEEETEPEPVKSSGGWFSFGSTDEPPEPEEPVKEEDSGEPADDKEASEEPSNEDLIKEEPEDAWTLSNELLSVSGEQEEDEVSAEKESPEKSESGPEEPEDDVKEGDQKNDELTPSEDEEDVIENEPPRAAAPSNRGPQSVEEDPVEEELYFNAEITNAEDWALKDELDDADGDLKNDRLREASEKYMKILQGHPNSGRARYGKALVLDREAEEKKSNTILLKAIDAYAEALESPNLTDALFLKIAQRTVDRMKFKGLYLKAVQIHGKIIQRFPDEPSYMNNLAINFLMMNRLKDAESTLKDVLKRWPENAMALAHFGLVLKLQGKNRECITYLEKGLQVDVPENNDARLYFHLGDALSRLNRSQDAMKVYEKGAEKGLFRSKYQRSLYNVDRLTARPWWTLEETTYEQFFRKLEKNWLKIREEGVAALKLKAFQDEAENLREAGDWKQFELFARGMKYKENCKKTPLTCSLIESFEPARGCRRGQSKFSVMEGGTHVWPHCGPTNCRLRAHLGLIVPPGTALRVAEVVGTWMEGKVIVFDDSFEHEVWHNGSSLRLVLIVDVWHPQLTNQERLSLSSI